MTAIIIGSIVFYISHLYTTFRTREPGRTAKDRYGENAYMGGYSVVSVVGLGLMIYGYATSDLVDPIYGGIGLPRSLFHVSMLVAFVLAVVAYVPRTHLARWTKHPMTISFTLWAALHLTTGADWPKLIVIGSFFAYGIVVLFVAFTQRPWPEHAADDASWAMDGLAVAVGTAIWAAFMFGLHQWMFGVSPV